MSKRGAWCLVLGAWCMGSVVAQDLDGLGLGSFDPQTLIQQGAEMISNMTPEEGVETAKSVGGLVVNQINSMSGVTGFSVDTNAFQQGIELLGSALRLMTVAEQRMRAHEAKLAERGIVEEPASQEANRYHANLGGFEKIFFDDWGELSIDRRFLTDEEMDLVKKIEDFVWKEMIEPMRGFDVVPPSETERNKEGERKNKTPGAETSGSVPTGEKPVKRAPRVHAGGAGLPVFRGFEDARYQRYDELIARMVADFNKNKAKWCGGNPDQAAKIADVTAAMVKSHMIEETGGNGPRSKAAWAVDPLQINVPGDWGPEKECLGLKKPAKRNEGTAEQNVRAAIMYLSRKGFGSSGKPAAVRPKGFFDGWPTALTRYNGRRDRTDTDRYYSEEYSDKIVKRAANPDLFVPIEIKMATKK